MTVILDKTTRISRLTSSEPSLAIQKQHPPPPPSNLSRANSTMSSCSMLTGLLRGSWALNSRVISRITMVKTLFRALVILPIKASEPQSLKLQLMPKRLNPQPETLNPKP